MSAFVVDRWIIVLYALMQISLKVLCRSNSDCIAAFISSLLMRRAESGSEPRKPMVRKDLLDREAYTVLVRLVIRSVHTCYPFLQDGAKGERSLLLD